MAEESSIENESISMPHESTLSNACKIAISEDRPIMLDYWSHSLNSGCFIGVRENDEKLLVKNEDEYTSPISKIYQVNNEYILTTENSLYIVHKNIDTKRIA